MGSRLSTQNVQGDTMSVWPQSRVLYQVGTQATSYLKLCPTLRSNCFPCVCHSGTRNCPQFFTVEVETQTLTSLRYTDRCIFTCYRIAQKTSLLQFEIDLSLVQCFFSVNLMTISTPIPLPRVSLIHQSNLLVPPLLIRPFLSLSQVLLSGLRWLRMMLSQGIKILNRKPLFFQAFS